MDVGSSSNNAPPPRRSSAEFDAIDTTAFTEAGEALTIADRHESWMFHILADDTGRSAVWAAQRVPEGHVSACANQFVIREAGPAWLARCEGLLL